MPKELLQSRVESDVIESVEELAKDKDITKSEAHRRCVLAGLRQHGYEITMADGMGVVDMADRLDDIETKRERQHNQLRQDMQILAAGLAVGVVGVLVAVAGISPLATVAALAVGVISASFTFGMTVFRRVIT